MSPSTVTDAMRATNRIFEEEVVRKRDLDALTRVYTRDARILPPGAAMVEGRAAIIEFWRVALDQLGVEDGRLETVKVEQTGDTLIEIGRAELSLTAGVKVDAKYVVAWKREDGRWKWHVDIWNMNA